MKLCPYRILLLISIVLISISEVIDGIPFSVFPLLTTGWYYKPGPVESIILGFLVVKVLAIRLGATLAGVPYHLNDIFDSKKSELWNARGKRYISIEEQRFHNSTAEGIPATLSQVELEIVERLLLALRRIDSHDCFIQYICRVHQNSFRKQLNSDLEEAWVKIFRLRPKEKRKSKDPDTPSVWEVYEAALSSRTNCTAKYPNCPLTSTDLEMTSLLAGIF